MSSRLALALPALALVGVAGWEIVATRRAAGSVPGDDAWDAAAQRVRRDWKRGDLIVFAPAWNDPVGRLHLGDLLTIHDAARNDAARYPRIWELAIRGARSPDVHGAPAIDEDIEGIAVRRYDQAPVRVLADFRDRIGTVQIEGNRTRGPTVELQEVGFEPHECVLVVPTSSEPVRLTFPKVAIGSSIVGYAGLADVFTRREIRVPGRIQIAIDDLLLADAHLGVDDGWVRFEAPTTPHVGDVTIIVSGDAAQRQICFDVETRE